MKDDLVLGIGNLLLSDEGAGVHAVQYLVDNYALPPSVTVIDGGTLSFSLAEYVENSRSLIVFDAAQLNKLPGTVQCLVGAAMDEYLGSTRSSVHEVGLADVMDIVRLSGHAPRKRALIAIQPAKLGWGEHLSEPVAAAVPRAVQHAFQLLADWLPVTAIGPVLGADHSFVAQEGI